MVCAVERALRFPPNIAILVRQTPPVPTTKHELGIREYKVYSECN